MNFFKWLFGRDKAEEARMREARQRKMLQADRVRAKLECRRDAAAQRLHASLRAVADEVRHDRDIASEH